MSENGQQRKRRQDAGKKTFIIFSGEMDKVLAGFVLANAAAAMDDEVTMFFTFWGLNALRREHPPKTHGKTAPAADVRDDDAARPEPSRPSRT